MQPDARSSADIDWERVVDPTFDVGQWYASLISDQEKGAVFKVASLLIAAVSRARCEMALRELTEKWMKRTDALNWVLTGAVVLQMLLWWFPAIRARMGAG